MSREWDDRRAGKRPIRQDEPEMESQSVVSCITTELTTKAQLQILTIFSFLIPGMGESGKGCMSKIVNAISSLGNAVRIITKKCKMSRCPNCFEWWISEATFKYAVLIECYAKMTGERPAHLTVSVHPHAVRTWTWKDYSAFFRTAYNRLYKLNITGGIRVFHPFRVKYDIQGKLRSLGYYGYENKGKGGFWRGIRENALNLSSWRDYVYLGAHLHIIGFPSWVKENTTKDIVIKKIRSLNDVRDVVGTLRYQLSHCGILTDGENEPASEFGCLHGFKPEKYLTYEEILSIKQQVAEAMGVKYNIEKDRIEVIKDDEKDDKYTWIPLHEFAVYNKETVDSANAFIESIPNLEHREFVASIIGLYHERRTNKELEPWKRNVFLEDLKDIPKGFDVVIVDGYGDENEKRQVHQLCE